MNGEANYREIVVFETQPIKKSILQLAVPTVLSQLVFLIYNMVDTWFIGKTGDVDQMAAITVSYPLYMILVAIGNMYGIGGSSFFARLLGSKDYRRAECVAGFSIWASCITVLVYGLIIACIMDPILGILGAEGRTIAFGKQYLFWTVIVGGIPIQLNVVLANLLRAKGQAKFAGFGVSLGGVLNIILDPLFIFVFGMGIKGAAIAIALANFMGMLYFLSALNREKEESVVIIPLSPRGITLNEAREVYSIGAPAAIQIVLASVSNGFLLGLMGDYDSAVISGLGISQKLEAVPFQTFMGISSGAMPLIAYNYASGNKKRMRDGIKIAIIYGLIITIAFLTIMEVFAPSLIRLFLNDPITVEYGSVFLRLRNVALPFVTIEFMLIAVFQGVGKSKEAFALSIFRKGIVDIPIMLLFQHLWYVYGLMLVQPLMEVFGCILAVWLYTKLR